MTAAAAIGADLDARKDDLRRRNDPNLNGIDFVEIDPADHRIITVTFLLDLPPAAYGLDGNPDRVTITGGVRIVGLRAVQVTRVAPRQLVVTVDQPGDASTYTITFAAGELDEPLATAPVSFVATCPSDVDCATENVCDREPPEEPLLDYLAKDYASFRRLLLEVARSRNPSFRESNPAELTVTLIELLAYEGDRLSYYQDAVATEAYLSTARTRRAVRRHARLVDYRVHDGRNAWTWVTFDVAENAAGVVERGTALLTRLSVPLQPGDPPPGPVIDASIVNPASKGRHPALRGVTVFETAHDVLCDPRNNELQIHTFGQDDAVLPTGSMEAWLFNVGPGNAARRPQLHPGATLVFEEVRGVARPGLAVDADATHRHAVVLTEVEDSTDRLYSATLIADSDGRWQLQPGSGIDVLPLVRVRWRREDALPFPLCVSVVTPTDGPLRSVAVARGNVALADHGLTVTESVGPVADRTPIELKLTVGPLTVQAPADDPQFDQTTGASTAQRFNLSVPAGECLAAAALRLTSPTGRVEVWRPVADLLDSTPFDHHFVAEIDDDGAATLRAGDGTYGADAAGASAYQATYRVGSGPEGNVSADTLVHVAVPTPTPGGYPDIVRVRNPLPARGGTAAETLAEIRVRAPEAFRADQRRAVTEDDYAKAALRLASVQGAVASFRWTGSWLTVFVAVDPADENDLVEGPGSRPELRAAFAAQVRAQLQRFRQAGYDLELRLPRFAAIELDIGLCVRSGYFRADVVAAVRQRLSRFVLPDGTTGFFHPRRWTFGQPLRTSAVYAAVEAVEGVDSLEITQLRRLGDIARGEIEAGVLRISPFEIVRCDNDPNFLERGVLRITAHGGKA